MLNIKDIQQFKTSSFGNVILVENIIPYNLNPFRDEILSLKSILYFVPTALFCGAEILSTNILSLAGQVKLTLMRSFGKTKTISKISLEGFCVFVLLWRKKDFSD